MLRRSKMNYALVVVLCPVLHVLCLGNNIAFVYDDFHRNIEHQWISPLRLQLESLVKEIVPAKPFSAPKLPLSVHRYWARARITGVLILASCKKANNFIGSAEYSNRARILRLDGEPCKVPYQHSIALPITYAKNQYSTFQLIVHSWVENFQHAVFFQLLAEFGSKVLTNHGMASINRITPVSLLNSVATGPEKFASTYLKGKTLKFGTAEYPPHQRFTINSGNIREPDPIAMAFSVIATLANYYDFRYNIVMPQDGKIGSLVNGSWNGVVGMAVRKEVDFVAALLGVTHPRSLVIDFSYFVNSNRMAAIIPPAASKSKVWAMTAPFDLSVWMTVIATLIFCSWIAWFNDKNSSEAPERRMSLEDYLFYFFRVTVLQGEEARLVNSNAFRFNAGAWCLATIILVESYSSALKSAMTVPQQELIVTSMEDLAYRYPITLLVQRSTGFESNLLNAEHGIYKILGDRIRNHPEQLVNSQEEGLRRVLTGQNAFFGAFEIFQYFVSQDYERQKKCRFAMTYSTTHSLTSYEAFLAPKDSLLLPAVNAKLMAMAEFGILNVLRSQSLSKQNPCMSAVRNVLATTSYRIGDLVTAFGVLFGGILVASVLLLTEIASYKSKMHRMPTFN